MPPRAMAAGAHALLLLLATAAAPAPGDLVPAPGAGLAPVPGAALRVTQGELRPVRGETVLQVDGPRLRAVAPAALASRAALRFTYLGPSAAQRPLRSGEARRQVGLKLAAEDGCNVLYVMWRLEPRGELVVSLKRNPGRRRSDDCENRGYRNLRPREASPVEAPLPGEPHLLEAEVRGGELRVRADGVLRWSGPLPAEALALRGPAGLRSDNGRFVLELLLPEG